MGKSIYSDFILKNVPRIITQIDRDEHSTTYGSCDRNHWHLKIRDFSSAILQQNGLALALLYAVDFEGNIYYKNQNIRKWAEATVYYWAKIQLRDGSFNEYYPFEHGFPPTAFSLYSSSEVYKRLEMNDPDIVKKFRKTAKYLISHIEKKAFNQEIASIAALFSVYTITKDAWIMDGMNKKLSRVLHEQTDEGWFPEYGGADLGYLSVSLDMLGEYYNMSKDSKIEESIIRVLDFLKYFIHPDGTIGGEYGSRNTTYFLPNGIEVALQLGNSEAAAIKEKLYRNSDSYNYFMDSVDDRYFSHYLMHSFLRALEKEQTNHVLVKPSELPYSRNHIRFFNQSGLISLTKENIHAVISLKKGGIVKLWNENEEIFVDCGYRVNYGKGVVAATNWLDPDYQIDYGAQLVTVHGRMNKVALKVSTPLLHIGLRITAFVVGNRIIGFLKKKMIFSNKHSDINFLRSIKWNESELIIQDTLESKNLVDIEKASSMSLRHVASGKFFSQSDLLCLSDKVATNVKKASITIKISLLDGKVEHIYE